MEEARKELEQFLEISEKIVLLEEEEAKKANEALTEIKKSKR